MADENEPMNTEQDRIDCEYRQTLETLEHSSQEKYDQAIMTLSGGALGVTFAFVKDVSTPENAAYCSWLLSAWFSWGFSVTAVLFSFFFSQMALRKTIRQVDDKTYRQQRLGGWYNGITAVLNVLGGVAFLLGVVLFSVFTAQALPNNTDNKDVPTGNVSEFQEGTHRCSDCPLKMRPPPPPPSSKPK